MTQIRVFHTADCHLGAALSGFGAFAQARAKDLLTTFHRLADKCKETGAHAFIVAGDLFDNNRPGVELLSEVKRTLCALASERVAVVLLPGNHDSIEDPDSVYLRESFGDEITIVKPGMPCPIEINTPAGKIYLYAYAGRSRASDVGPPESMRRREGQGFHLGVLHASMAGNPEWETKSRDLTLNLDAIKAMNFDYLALGHFHRHQVFRDGDRILASYPGTPEARTFDETGPRYANLVAWEDGRVSLDEIQVQTRIVDVRGLDVTPLESQEAVEREICKLADPNLIAKIELTGTSAEPLDAEALQQDLQACFAWLVVEDGTDSLSMERILPLAGERSVRGIFLSKALDKYEAFKTAGQEKSPEAVAIMDAIKAAMTEFRRSGIKQ